jgi:predicted small metal-binding protein
MALQLCCTCGYTFRAEDDDALWEKAQAHIKAAHPEMVGMVRRDDLLAQAELV